MVVKAKRGRRRYIAFVVSESTVSNEDLLSALNSSFSQIGRKVPKIIQFDGSRGIVRTSDVDKEKAIEALNNISVERGSSFSLRTLRTSGTLRTLRERYFKEDSRPKGDEKG